MSRTRGTGSTRGNYPANHEACSDANPPANGDANRDASATVNIRLPKLNAASRCNRTANGDFDVPGRVTCRLRQ
jgi:hypothetical protein